MPNTSVLVNIKKYVRGIELRQKVLCEAEQFKFRMIEIKLVEAWRSRIRAPASALLVSTPALDRLA